MYRLAIFDMDQTLVNTLHRFHKIFNLALRHFHCKEAQWDEFIDHYKADTLNDYVCTSKRQFWDYFLSHYNDIDCEKDTLIPGAKEVIEELKRRGMKIAIVTGRMVPASKVWEELEKFGLAQYVDLVLTRADNYCDGHHRTELLKEAMRRLNAKPEETFFVGDYWPDMQSGREAGIYTIGVLTGHENEEVLKENGADVVLSSVAELFKLGI
ncbi:MAG: HAD family hydrolase [Euryarchaeota archaeon]|nr:HAD family hydrolase [Euryarchaeota archaeon]